MRDKGVISQAEFESAVHDLSESVGQHSPDEGTMVMGKWATTLYGFVEADQIYDTTRSFNDLAGSTPVGRDHLERRQQRRRQRPHDDGHPQLARSGSASRRPRPRAGFGPAP